MGYQALRSAFVLSLVLGAAGARDQAQASVPMVEVQPLLTTLIANENAAAQHRDPCLYLSHERSERTGGHLWTERVAETDFGKIRFLIEEDGKPLSPERAAQERARLADVAAHPDDLRRKDQSLKSDETHARQMLVLLPRRFSLRRAAARGTYLRIHYRPNPAYQPQSMEEAHPARHVGFDHDRAEDGAPARHRRAAAGGCLAGLRADRHDQGRHQLRHDARTGGRR